MDKQRLIMLGCGLFAIAAGLFPMLDALGVFPGSDERMNAPWWVVFLAGSLFFMAGMWLLLQSIVGEAKALAFGSVVGVALFLGLTLLANWVAFGGGDRNDCSGGLSALGIGFESGASDLECRAAFGYGALLLDFLLLRGIAWQAAQRAPANPAARALEKLSEWGIGLLLLPLVLLVLALTKGKEGVAKLASKLRPSQKSQD